MDDNQRAEKSCKRKGWLMQRQGSVAIGMISVFQKNAMESF